MPGFELINSKEKKAIDRVFKNGAVLFRHGFENIRNNNYEVLNFEKNFSRYIGTKYALGVTSGTAALRVGLAAIGIKPGDEVITQSFTFVATIEAIVESGATPVIVNVDKNLDLDVIDLKRKITNKTKCIIPVHMLGNPSKMKEITRIARSKKIYIIEDVAWGLGGSYKNKKLGSIGDIGAFSFDHAKALTTGEGGMLTFSNKKLFMNAKAWHDHGHENNPKLPRWEDSRTSSGFNFRMNEIQGAIGNVQLSKLNKVIKFQIDKKNKLAKIAFQFGFKVRTHEDNNVDTCDSFIFFTKNSLEAKKLKIHLSKYSISTKILPEAISWHFAGKFNHIKQIKQIKTIEKNLKVSEKYLSKAISLPIMLKDNKIEYKFLNALKRFDR